MHDNKDLSIIKNIQKVFKNKTKTFPQLVLLILYYIFIKRIKYIGILNYFPYNKNEALSKLQNLGLKTYEQTFWVNFYKIFKVLYYLINLILIKEKHTYQALLYLNKFQEKMLKRN